MTKRKKKYFPNNLKHWNSMEATDDLTEVTLEDLEWNVCSYEIGRPYCCLIRTKDSNGKVKEYAYKQMKSAQKKLAKLIYAEPEIVEFTVVDDYSVQTVEV